jgi:hypothetical protein
MPLLDHFHPPLEEQYSRESFHANWATRIADLLNDQWLSREFLAAEFAHAGPSLEIDVATTHRPGEPQTANGSTTATLMPKRWSPPKPTATLPAVFPDSFEVRVFSLPGGRTLVGAIELISPGNKDRAEKRTAFASKVVSYLQQGVSVIVIDVVTNRRANLHNDTMRLIEADSQHLLGDEVELYAVAYRPVLRDDKPQIDLWTAACAVGRSLPTMPLRLTGDVFVPVDFEATYQEACRRRRLA